MGLATIDPHNQKEHTEIHKFGVNRPKSKQDTTIWKCQCTVSNSRVQHSVRMPWAPDAIHFFVNFDVFESLYLSQN